MKDDGVQMVLPFDTDQYGPWIVTQKADRAGSALANAHYSRQTIGAAQFCRPGKNLVLRTVEGNAVWVTWHSEYRKDGLEAWENTLFRNESSYLSSDLIKWAIFATICEWGDRLPRDGIITYVQASAVKSTNPGCCYLNSGFRRRGSSKSRRLQLLQLPVDKTYVSLQEVSAVKYLEKCREFIQIAMDDGDHYNAIEFYREAKRTEDYLRALKSARQRLKFLKRDCFEPTADPLDLLYELCPDGWIPEEMLELFDDHNEL
ncbi:hypothetical protein [Paenibacillus sp. GYB003]|uniref:hypothetical protein n=1 Tax=Paenibacillus sp. GYB003 TaxID=2994392 RepID=UPI002F96196E